jgi:hypothetical protein
MERAFGLEIPRTLQEVCRPDRLALLVYDMQAGMVVPPSAMPWTLGISRCSSRMRAVPGITRPPTALWPAFIAQVAHTRSTSPRSVG